MFAVRDVGYHSNLKKVIGGLYTKNAVLSLEPSIDYCTRLLTSELSKRTHASGPTRLDMSLWVHLYCFDSLGEINVSKMFGFMEKGADFNGMIDGSDRILIKTGLVRRPSSRIKRDEHVVLTGTKHPVRTISNPAVRSMASGSQLGCPQAQSCFASKYQRARHQVPPRGVDV